MERESKEFKKAQQGLEDLAYYFDLIQDRLMSMSAVAKGHVSRPDLATHMTTEYFSSNLKGLRSLLQEVGEVWEKRLKPYLPPEH